MRRQREQEGLGHARPGGQTGHACYDAAVADAVNTRVHPRVPVEAVVKVAGGNREYALHTRDLSQSGLFLYTRLGAIYPFRIGTTLDLELLDEEGVVHCRAVVARVVKDGTEEARLYPTGFAVRIVEMSERDRERLRVIVERAGQPG